MEHKRYRLFDIESDGLLDSITKIHVLVIRDHQTKETFTFTKENMRDGLKMLMEDGYIIVGHNVINYDVPALKKIYPDFHVPEERVLDTIVLTRLIYTDLPDTDGKLIDKGILPKNMFKRQSLESWGYRLGEMKGEYKDWFKQNCKDLGIKYESGMEWLEVNQQMIDYCVQDVHVTHKLFEKILAENYSEESIELEHQVAWLMSQQERNGFYFDEEAAGKLYADLIKQRTTVEDQLVHTFGSWFKHGKQFVPKKDNKKQGYSSGVPFTKVEKVTFNPGSRAHIAERLTKLYGWKPIEFTPSGQPKVDEVVIGRLDYPPCKLLTEYLMIQKRCGQIAEGDGAWLKYAREGKIHGRITTGGAVTGRATHSNPNLSQVPANDKPYGKECRALFGVPNGWILVGADASGLELRCLGHFMAKYDGGKYAKSVVEGKNEDGTDVHTLNQKAAGLPTRGMAKTFIYAFLYGAGDAKIGLIIGKGAAAGKLLKARFLKQTPALAKLIDAVRKAARRGYLIGLDGRKLYVRSSHAALNTLLQSAGAILCKKWLVLLEESLRAKGLKHGWNGDYAFCMWSHDEVQIACRTPEVAEIIKEAATHCVTKAGEHFKFRCPLAGESKTGTNWMETH